MWNFRFIKSPVKKDRWKLLENTFWSIKDFFVTIQVVQNKRNKNSMPQTHTKIVCTIGPSVASVEKMVELIEAGMNVGRLNFSHGSHEEHFERIQRLKRAREIAQVPVAIMLDTKGPEIRLGYLPEQIRVKQKMRLVLSANGSHGSIPVHPFEALASVQPGLTILFDDGYIISKAIDVSSHEVVVEIQNEGVLKTGKKINVPNVKVHLPGVTQDDVRDIQFGCEQDVDMIAASFIRSAGQVQEIKKLLAQQGKADIQVIAKIESSEGVQNIDQIIQAADGLMVARGDLGVEVDLAIVPRLQKMMIRKCNQAGKPVITATQMLESMIEHPRPTRAEVSDVANAIYDCSSAVMLSGETAVGQYPIETVHCMRHIIEESEGSFDYRQLFDQRDHCDYHDASPALAVAAVQTAYSANARAIFVFTTTGRTARLISHFCPQMPIVALTLHWKVYQQLALLWGVVPVYCPKCPNVREAFHEMSSFALKRKLISFGDVVVMTAGLPFGKVGLTNMMILENIGDVIVRGDRGVGSRVRGKTVFVFSPEHLSPDSLRGCIAVIPYCDDSFKPVFKYVCGIILQNFIGDTVSKSAALSIANEYGISLICRADGALTLLREGEEVVLDPETGFVSSNPSSPNVV
jgi:pyruvate kinase